MTAAARSADRPSPRARLLDAGVAVLAAGGAAGLTHRAVEAAAAMPHGSTRYHFGSTKGLLRALVEHVATRDADVLTVPSGSGDRPPEALARALADVVERWLTGSRELVLARYELLLAAARDPELQQLVEAPVAAFAGEAAALLGPGSDGRRFVALLDGLLFDRATRGPGTRAALEDDLRALISACR